MTADPAERRVREAAQLSQVAIELSQNYQISYNEALDLATRALQSMPPSNERRNRDTDLLHTSVSFQLGWTLALVAVAVTPGLRPLLTLAWTYVILAVVAGVHYVLRRRRERVVAVRKNLTQATDPPDFIGQHEPPPYPSSGLDWEPEDPEDPYR